MPTTYSTVLCLSLACCLQRDAREVALRESWARERDAALDREQSAASTRIRDLSNRQAYGGADRVSCLLMEKVFDQNAVGLRRRLSCRLRCMHQLPSSWWTSSSSALQLPYNGVTMIRSQLRSSAFVAPACTPCCVVA